MACRRVLFSGREKDRERTTERERAREIAIKTTETQDARKRKRQRVQCDTCCTHKYSVERGYRTPLITRPDSTPSHVFICQKTKYFSGRRQLQGKRACGVSPVIELQQAHRSTAYLLLSKALAHDSAAMHLKMFQWIDTDSWPRTISHRTHANLLWNKSSRVPQMTATGTC